MDTSVVFFANFTLARVAAIGTLQKPPSLGRLLKGAVLSTSLRKAEQVERILGPTELLVGHRGVSVKYARRLGVCVFFCYDRLDRVESEFFEWLLREMGLLVGWLRSRDGECFRVFKVPSFDA